MSLYGMIWDSFYNGRNKQMVDQIDRLTITDFLALLEGCPTNESDKLELLIRYNRIKAK